MPDFDVIVVGSGAGGGTLANELAAKGKKVLLLEKGQNISDKSAFQDENEMLIKMRPYETAEVTINRKQEKLFSGAYPGGGTALFGAVMMRPSPEDFTPGKYYPGLLNQDLWEWPIAYEEMEPYYTRAEDRFEVSGDKTPEPPFIGKRAERYLSPAPALEPFNKDLHHQLERQGLNPFHLPMAIDFKTCLRCPTCPGYLCPVNARKTSMNHRSKNLVYREGAEVREIVHQNGKVSGVKVINGETRKTETITASVYCVSAGAIGSPSLLIRSEVEDKSSQLGRNYMYHAGAFAVGFFAKPTGVLDRFHKQTGVTDFYFGMENFNHKLGYIQSLPIPGPKSVNKMVGLPIPTLLLDKAMDRAFSLAATVEDLPQEKNRVVPGKGTKIRLTHSFHNYDIYRSTRFLKKLKELLYGVGASFVYGVTGDKDSTHVAHQVGTCRFGKNEKTSVLDPNCRVHAMDNLYVVDGSFMPTSLGVAPALTIAANAIRIADYLEQEVL